MGFLVAIFGFVAASEIIDLEPVKSGKYDCNEFSGAGNNTICNANPYCHFVQTGGANDCIDDPCLVIVDSTASTCDNDPTTGVNCFASPQETNLNSNDCVETSSTNSGRFCRSNANIATYDYCFYANLRDGGSKCPDSICQLVNKRCVPAPVASGCQYLLTKDDCILTPKCIWDTTCKQDPCLDGSLDQNCGTWKGNGDPVATRPNGDPLVNGDCVLYQPYKSDGTVASYCVYKDKNPTPNLCYFLNPTVATNPTDYGATYPTFPNPSCTGNNITNCDSNPSGECFTKINSKGAFAGKYCGDATHGAANILHVPSLAVFLLAFIIVSKFTL